MLSSLPAAADDDDASFDDESFDDDDTGGWVAVAVLPEVAAAVAAIELLRMGGKSDTNFPSTHVRWRG